MMEKVLMKMILMPSHEDEVIGEEMVVVVVIRVMIE